MLCSHKINMHIYTYTRRIHIDAIIKTSEDFFKKNIPLTLFERVVCERELETEQNCNILTPTLLAISAFLSRSPVLLNRGLRGSASLEHVPQSSILSLTRLIPNCSIAGLRAPSAGCWLSLSHLVSNWSGLQTNWLSVFTELYNSSTPPSSCGRRNCTHSTHIRSRLSFWYSSTGCTCYLTARPGRRSIYNTKGINYNWYHYRIHVFFFFCECGLLLGLLV